MDDLAPSPDAKQYVGQLTNLGTVIRSVHNRSAKRRSGAELRAREVFTPHAVFITTAENEYPTPSIRDRTIILNMDSTSLISARVENANLFRDSLVSARLTVACVQALQYLALQSSWKVVQGDILKLSKAHEEDARTIFDMYPVSGKANARPVGMAVDLMMGLIPLRLLAKLAGEKKVVEWLDSSNPGSLPGRIATHVAEGFFADSNSSTGRTVLDTLQSILIRGDAHVLNAHAPSEPPSDNPQTNRMLGWTTNSEGQFRPRGTMIGWLRGTSVSAVPDVVILDKVNAFMAAQKGSGGRIPAGSTSSMTFDALWTEELIHPYYLKKGKLRDRPTRTWSVVGGPGHIVGVPVHLDEFLGRAEFGD